MTALAPAAQARAKLASRRAIDLAGGVEAAALAVGRGKSTVGRWHALNDPDLPPFDAMLTLDQIAVAQGHLPALISHLASECSGVFLPMPSVQGDGEFFRDAGAIAEGAGELVGGLAADLSDDGQMSQREAMTRIPAADRLATVVGGLCQRLRERAGAK